VFSLWDYLSECWANTVTCAVHQIQERSEIPSDGFCPSMGTNTMATRLVMSPSEDLGY